MRPRIPEITRNLVIEKWLQANSRNSIAEELGIGRATVSAIIEEWSRSTGKDLAFQLRDFVLALRNSGLPLSDCITGFRVALVSKKSGIHIDELEHFLAEIYTACLSKGLEPRYVAQLLEDVVSLSEGLNTISGMSDHLRRMKDEKEILTNSIKRLKEEIACLHAERAAAEELRNTALENDRINQTSLNWYRDTKDELAKYGIPVDDIGKFAKALKGVSEARYDPGEVVSTYSDYHTIKYATHNMQLNLTIMEKDISGLEEKKGSLERSIASHTQTISLIEDLARYGIGMKELFTLRFKVAELAKANGHDDNLAWKKFMKDLVRYDAKLGFERDIQEHTIQLRKLIFLINDLSEYLGILVADSSQTKMGQEQKLSLGNIMNSYPNIVERVATLMEQTKCKNKKKNENENVETGRGCYSYGNGDIVGFDIKGDSYEVENGDIAGFDMQENRKRVSASNLGQKDSRESKVSGQFDPYSEIEEYKRLIEQSNKENGNVDIY